MVSPVEYTNFGVAGVFGNDTRRSIAKNSIYWWLKVWVIPQNMLTFKVAGIWFKEGSCHKYYFLITGCMIDPVEYANHELEVLWHIGGTVITYHTQHCHLTHDDVIKWRHFPHYWPFVRGIHRSPVNSLHKGQWCGALMFSLICVWINGWVNNCEAGDLGRHRAHYDVIVMSYACPHNDHCLYRWLNVRLQ